MTKSAPKDEGSYASDDRPGSEGALVPGPESVPTQGLVQEPKRRFHIARIKRRWFVACTSRELKSKPLARTVCELPLVIYRGDHGPAALIDRCAHRNVPLSLGEVCKGKLVCGYHGWAYEGDGRVTEVPALCGEASGKARHVTSYPVQERQGFVWVFLGSAEEIDHEPFEFPCLAEPGYHHLRYQATMQATLFSSVENILDVPHTAFLHRGLFRGNTRNTVAVHVRRRDDGVEAEYRGEPRPDGWIGRFLAPGGGTVEHTDRFLIPSVAQVEYRLENNHVLITNTLTPRSDFETAMFTVVSFRTRFPGALVKLGLGPLARWVLQQDKRMLAAQTEAVRRFDAEQFVHTEVDVLGPHIWRILKGLERGENPVASEDVTQFELRA